MEAPTVHALFEAAKRLGFDPRIEEKRHFPGRWSDRRGRILVLTKDAKTQVIRRIAERLPAALAALAAPAAEGKGKDAERPRPRAHGKDRVPTKNPSPTPKLAPRRK